MPAHNSATLHDFKSIKADTTWSFANLTQKQTRYITHGYYTYPAKFIPQLPARVISEFTSERETVVDPFTGSGTTAVEALIRGRRVVAVDINPVASLVAKVKATPIEPDTLKREFAKLESDLQAQRAGKVSLFDGIIQSTVPASDRIDYWFPKKQKEELGVILGRLSQIRNSDRREFFLVAFSQILKSCSIWMQRSVKPTRDTHKVSAKPLDAFLRQARFMLKQNQEFWNLVPQHVRDSIARYRVIECCDARTLPCGDGEASLVVTSPPYVTSYEYADLHQLTALWFEYFESLPQFRKQFIGSAHSQRAPIDLQSQAADSICKRLGETKKGREVKNYFADMLECFHEMRRALKPQGKACIVIGNTQLQGVEILNAEVFAEQMQSIGFCTHDVIKREIPSKILPQTRDPHNGRFTASSNSKKVLAYPVEYILIMEKM